MANEKPGNINAFINSFKKDLARPCNFEVEISVPEGFRNFNKDNPAYNQFYTMLSPENLRNMRFKCEQAELPPRAMTLVQQKTYGPLDYYPIQNVYNKSTLTFIVGDEMSEKYFFDFWMDMICPTHPRYNEWGIPGVRFDFEYKNNYMLDLIIRQKNLKGKSSYAVVLSQAFPTEIYSLPLSWAQQNDYHRLNVIFTYRYSYVMYDQWNADPNDLAD